MYYNILFLMVLLPLSPEAVDISATEYNQTAGQMRTKADKLKGEDAKPEKRN